METINRLDVQIINTCNLNCRGCISLSEFPRKGYYDIAQLELDCNNWSKRLQPKVVTLFGGEPLLHPKFFDCVKIIRNAWPNSKLRVITNGLFLGQIDPKKWYNINDLQLQISFHRSSDKETLNNYIKEILKLGRWKPVNSDFKHVFLSFKNNTQNFEIWCSHFQEFVVPYQYNNGKIIPYNSDPIKSHSICGSPNSPVLLNGKIYKCPPVGNLINLLGDWNNYKGLNHNDNISEFVNYINKPESICSGCPENKNNVIDHFDIRNIPNRKYKLL